jgi:hypothetical protein
MCDFAENRNLKNVTFVKWQRMWPRYRHGLLKLEDGTLVLSRRVIACRVDF